MPTKRIPLLETRLREQMIRLCETRDGWHPDDLAGSGCAGFVLGLDVARSRAMSGGKKVLVVGVELLTRLMDWSDRATCVLFGDAAGTAVVDLTGEGGGEFLKKKAGAEAPAVSQEVPPYHCGWTTVPSLVPLSTTDEKTMNLPPGVSVQTSM
jgi:hypothetical protein